ncbi:MAG: ATP-binding protein [Ferruginibacter sp.]
MKRVFYFILISLVPFFAVAQHSFPDSVFAVLQKATTDSMRYLANMEIGYYYSENDRDTSVFYYNKAFLIARNNKNKLAEASALSMLGYQLSMKGQYSRSLQYLLDAFSRIKEDDGNKSKWMFSPGFKSTQEAYHDVALSRNQGIYSALMRNTENKEQELLYLKQSIVTAKRVNYLWRVAVSDLNLTGAYLKLNKPDSALIFGTEGLKYIRQTDEKKYESALLIELGNIYFKKGQIDQARQYYYDAMQSAQHNNASSHTCWANFALCNYYLKEKNTDSSLYYANKTMALYFYSATPSHIFTLGDVYENLFKSYQLKNEFDSAFKYQGLTRLSNDSIYKDRIRKLADFQNLGFAEQMRLRDIEKEKLSYQSKIRIYALLAGIGIFMLIAFLLYRNMRNRKKANIHLQKQRDEIIHQKATVEETLNNLKSTQAQLIQSEKMASLGELTAGIAHEIQNPLNFVNNFSEVSKELLDEMKMELDAGKFEDAKEIANDVIQNLEKINHHGKRADAIVKGMLQHSRSSSATKEPTDINALTDEYIRLCYHGLRAKDKSFNATIKTDFDESLQKINIFPQDIGRVVLNLLTNAFYAVDEKKKACQAELVEAGLKYEPIVSIQTKKLHDKVEIKVSDNGSGIPQIIVDKIFQPFFTTKPTGQGTGLGLSLSYDIITKGHGGELKVETSEAEGTTFIIQLPVTHA